MAAQAKKANFDRFGTKEVEVGVVGLGYVGLPLALLFARRGFKTTGFDVDGAKIERLEAGETYIKHITTASIAEQRKDNRFRATSDFRELTAMDAIIICVPTPLDEHREPDLTAVRDTTETIRQHLRAGQLVVLESTTYPGTTDDEVLPILEQSGLRCPVEAYRVDGTKSIDSKGQHCDFLLAFSPEREDPGNRNFETHQIPKVVGGVNGASARAAHALYGQVFERAVLVSSSRAAEMTKILENTYRCVNIALVNELKLLSERMGIDIWEVIEAAKTKPFGFNAFYPGPGLGGHCIPIDPFYLTWKAREYDFPTRFIELAGEINASMPEHVVTSLARALDQRKQCLNGAAVLVLGVSYKKDIDDLRESPSLRIIKLLRERGAQVDYHDPYFPRLHKMRHYDFEDMVSVELTAESLSRFTAVVISTDHSAYDYPFIVRSSRLVIDTRNATHQVKENLEKIVHC
ncbi:MAG TPA: nucleotide sugar dehydrogenase [Terriglobia bacterium]|nr:nucleotide sugar dehydrogenase [Terriglobia bacterium]